MCMNLEECGVHVKRFENKQNRGIGGYLPETASEAGVFLRDNIQIVIHMLSNR